jgi:fermentation-respiration switch protein FrsA (DUF1100 family)
MPPGVRRFMEWLLVLAVIVVCVPLAAWLAQDSLLFFPQPVAPTVHLQANAAPLEIAVQEGLRLRGWIVRGTVRPAPTVIYFGGNAEEVSWTLSDARWPREWSIVGVNYRGYGASEGRPSEAALKADALAIYDAVSSRDDVDPRRMVVFGRSLGTAIAVRLAAERQIAAAVLVSPYDSMVAVGRVHYPWLPVSLLLRHRFEACVDARRDHVPLLAIVGDDDTIIPPERSRALYDAWAGPKSWVAIPGAGHNDLGTDQTFWGAVDRFLAAH